MVGAVPRAVGAGARVGGNPEGDVERPGHVHLALDNEEEEARYKAKLAQIVEGR